MTMLRCAFALAACLWAVGVTAGPAVAQTTPGANAVGFEVGLPLVLGLDLDHRMTDRWRAGLGLGRIAGLTAVRAEARWLLRAEQRRRLVPVLLAGGEQYLLKDGDRDATPVGVHAGVGFDYHTDSSASFTVRLGGLKTFGSSGAGDLRVFGIENGFASGFFNIGARIHF